MKIFEKSLQVFTAISIFALACTNLNAAVTITQDDLSGACRPNISSWLDSDGYANNNALGSNWRSTTTEITFGVVSMSNNLSRLECRTEMAIGTIYVLARIRPEDQFSFNNALTVELGKRKNALTYKFGDSMLADSSYAYLTNTVAGTAIMSTATFDANIYRDENSRYMLLRYDLNLPENFCLRIFPSNKYNGCIQIKDIVIAPPVADVKITKEDLEYHPGYPSVLDPVNFKIKVQSASSVSSIKASNFSPKLYWRENGGAWQNKDLKKVSITANYTNNLVNLPAGNVEYFYRVDFDTPTNFVYKIVNENEISNLENYADWIAASPEIDDCKTISTTKSPAYYPYATDMQLYDMSVNPPDYYEYLGFDVRRFRSKYENVSLSVRTNETALVSNLAPRYDMELVSDYTWETVMHSTNAYDVGIFVNQTKEYLGSTSTEFGDNKHLGQQGAAGKQPPMFGNVDTTSTNGIPLVTDYNGYIMFRICTTNEQYQIRRAEWQNFNEWAADDTFFDATKGLIGIKEFTSNLDGWDIETYKSCALPVFEQGGFAVTNSGKYVEEQGLRFLYTESAYDRVKALNATANNQTNAYLRVSTYPIGIVESTSTVNPLGVDTLRFRTRTGFTGGNPAYYKNGNSFENYTVKATFSASDMTDGLPYCSVIAYRQDEDNYFEFRVTCRTRPDGDNLKQCVRGELWQCKNGVMSLVADKNNSKNFYMDKDTGYTYISANTKFELNLRMKTSGSQVEPFAQYRILDGNSQKAEYSRTFTLCSLANGVALGGTIGVDCSDVAASVTFAMTDETSADKPNQDVLDDAIKGAVAKDWYLGGIMPSSGNKSRWKITEGNSTTSCTLTRNIPAAPYQIQVFRNGLDDDHIAVEGTERKWVDIATASADTLSYEWVEYPMHFWDNVFFRIVSTCEAVGDGDDVNDAYIAVDDMSIYGWRGMEGVDREEADAHVWTYFYGMKSQYMSFPNTLYEFAVSRADPDGQQFLSSPLIDSLGDMSFTYRVTGGPIKYKIQYSLDADVALSWTTVKEVTVAPTDGVKGASYSFLQALPGRARILIEPTEYDADGKMIGGSHPDAVIWIDDIILRNYPIEGVTSYWSGYNVLVSPLTDANKFDIGNTSMKSSVLNNSPTEDTVNGKPFPDDFPNIESPINTAGIGEICFWYRHYDDNPTLPGKISIQVAPEEVDEETGLREWKTISTADLNSSASNYEEQKAMLLGLSNITTNKWTYFKIEVYDTQNKVFRIISDYENCGRVMFDNILITEPVRSSVEVGEVIFVPNDIPLYTDKVGINVRLANYQMDPTDIKVEVSYIASSNKWGVANWNNNSTPNVVRTWLKQDSEDPTLYVMDEAYYVPKQAIDAVVQYDIRILYNGIFASPIYYHTAFENPKWYYPVDLNKQYANPEDITSSSPYFFVFSCTTNAVKINEIQPLGEWGTEPSEFIELIGPKHTPIGNWTMDIYGADFDGDRISTGPEHIITLPASAAIGGTPKLASGEVDKGWGFYVLGNSGVANRDMWLFPDEDEDTGDSSSIYLDGAYSSTYGAIGLKRSMGAYADAIIWGGGTAKSSSGYKKAAVKSFVDEGFKIIYNSASQGHIIGSTAKDETTLHWRTIAPALATAGAYNYYSQNLAIPYVSSSSVPSTPPEIGVSIVNMIINEDSSKVEFIFKLWSTNGIAVDSSDFTWYVESAPTVDFAESTRHKITGETITAEADGTEAAYSVILDLSDSDAARFFKIIAVPTL